MSAESPIALITGGSRGLGRNAALHAAHRGIDVVLTYHSKGSEAESTVAEIERLGRRAVALQLDVAASAAFDGFVERLRAALSRKWQREHITFLVNNAGHGAYSSIAETTEAQFDEMINVHLKATFFLTQKLLPLIADGGRIVNVSSGLARFSLPGYAAYAAAKGGVEVLTRYMAKELGPRGIAVNVIAPGAIATDFGGGRVRDDAEVNAQIASQTALGRVGVADDIGSVIASLLSQDWRWANGQRIEISGGIYL
jgi:NAD(P)-dependent dehydrogenase (short-subunit alcohol dehydrogenase family)